MTNEDLIIMHKAESIIAKYNDITNDRSKAIKCAILDVERFRKTPSYTNRVRCEHVDTLKLKKYLESLIE